jgi:sensor histidine kinase YesM
MYKPQPLSNLLKIFLLTLLFNTLIALVLAALGGLFYNNMVFSQCIGLSIFALYVSGNQSGLFNSTVRRIVLTMASIVGGALVGTYAAMSILGRDPATIFGLESHRIISPIILGLFFGVIVMYFFYSRIRLTELHSQAQQEQLQRLAGEKELAEAQLKLVQAQIEPHFLFNTLANIVSLIGDDALKAQTMLEDLNRYLRTALARTRQGKTTLGDEVELLTAYLSIIQVRMDKRLRYQLEIPGSLHDIGFPPLLLQPLVENAIRHGLEPKVDGGAIIVSGKIDSDKLIVSVIDDGLGLQGDWHPGIGLDNVYQRLQALFGNEGELAVVANAQGGVTSTIAIPLPDIQSEK